MKRIVLALVAIGIASPAFADGAATYAKKCAMCHGKAGEGKPMAPKPIAGLPAAEVKKAILEGVQGKKKMPAVKMDEADAEVVASTASPPTLFPTPRSISHDRLLRR
jgi:cytochrome c6